MVLTNLSHPHPPLPSSNTAQPSTASDNGEKVISPSPGVIIPVYSSWFEMGKIHEIERRSLPEFFPSKEPVPGEDKTATAYLEYRDFMVQTYRLRPHDYLTVTTCRRHLTGDVGAIIRVHSFLEQWGLINFQADAPAARRERPVQVGNGGIELPTAISGAVQAAALRASLAAAIDRSTQQQQQPTKISCSSCSVECPRLYYSGGSNLTLCGLCYAEGKYPSNLSASDFTKMDVASAEQGLRQSWTDDETLQLLSAVEEFPNDWDSVAQKVGRPKDQCVFQFLRLPAVEGIDPVVTDVVGGELGKMVPVVGSVPFSAAANPIMSTLAFLAAAVHPKVAAAAAQAALCEVERLKAEDTMMKDDPPDNETLSQVSATGLACAAARSSLFAEEESKKAARLRDSLVDLQLQKLRVKMALFEDLERTLEDDRKELEQQRLQLFFDRFNLRKQMIAIEQKAGLERMEFEPAENEDHSVNPKTAQNITKL